MFLKTIHLTSKLTFILSMVILSVVLSAVAWVVTGPRSLLPIKSNVEAELNSISDEYKFKISESFITWDKNEKSFVIDISDVDIINKNDLVVANFPKVSFDFSMINFFKGNILSSDVTLTNPTFNLDSSKLFFSPNNSSDIKDKIENELISRCKEFLKKNNFPIRALRVKDAELFFDNGISEFVWHVRDGYLKINTSNTIISELNINLGKEQTYLGISLSTEDESDTIDISIKFKDLPTYIYADLFPQIKIFDNINIISDGDLNFLLSETGYIPQLQFNIYKAVGNLTFLDFFKETINFDSMAISGNFYDHFSTATINKFNVKINEAELSLSATLHNIQKSFPDLNANVAINNFQISDLDKYWPLKLSSVVRNWVTSNISEGLVTDATGNFVFNTEDFEAIKKWQTSDSKDFVPLKSNSIDATLNIQNAKVNFHHDYPAINNAQATVTFSGTSLTANIAEAGILESSITTSKVQIDNMWLRPAYLTIDGNFNGKTKDVTEIIKIPLNKIDVKNKLEHIYAATGPVSGNVKLSLPIKNNLKYNDIDIEVSSNFSKTNIPKLINGYDISDAEFSLNFKDNKLDAKGTAGILDSRLSFAYLNDIEALESSYKINGDITTKEIEILKIATIPFVEEKVNLDINIKDHLDIKHVTGTLDLENAVINIEKLGFKKNAGINSKVTFDLKQHADKTVNINNFRIEGEEISAYGDMLLKNSRLVSLNLKEALFAGNNFNATYSNNDNNYVIKIKGKSFDFKNAEFGKLIDNLNSKKNKKFSLLIKTELDKVFMKNNTHLTALTSNIQCTQIKCTAVNLYAKTLEDGFLTISMKPDSDHSTFILESDNAGVVIKSLGVSNYIKNGRLTVESTFRKDKAITAQGIIQIQEFKAIKTPILGKLLTLASLKGISDLLNNKGIQFERFSAPFDMAGNIITLKDAKTAGSSIGITARGTINLTNKKLDLSGAIVPAYAVNKLLGEIPVLGRLLVGKKNEGILATTYKIEGPYENAKVAVNPLTILTPGFLRNIFDIF